MNKADLNKAELLHAEILQSEIGRNQLSKKSMQFLTEIDIVGRLSTTFKRSFSTFPTSIGTVFALFL